MPVARFRKTVEVLAYQADEAGECDTLEGRVRYAAGDFLCSGVAGELWPRPHDAFLADYAAAGEPDGDGWRRYRRRGPISAVRQDVPFEVVMRSGQAIRGKAGDWLAWNENETYIIDADVFAQSYEMIDGGAPDEPIPEIRQLR